MTSRGLSAWLAVAFSLLAILVAVDRPHWFGWEARAAAAPQRATKVARETHRSSPWLIRRAPAETR